MTKHNNRIQAYNNNAYFQKSVKNPELVKILVKLAKMNDDKDKDKQRSESKQNE
jgi:hypothetical protein